MKKVTVFAYSDINFDNYNSFAFYKTGIDNVKISDIDKKRIIVPLPLTIAKLSSKILQKLPKPLITEDQLRLLAYDNISSGDYKTNFDIGIPSKSIFDKEVKKYCFMWREAGQFSTNRYVKN